MNIFTIIYYLPSTVVLLSTSKEVVSILECQTHCQKQLFLFIRLKFYLNIAAIFHILLVTPVTALVLAQLSLNLALGPVSSP